METQDYKKHVWKALTALAVTGSLLGLAMTVGEVKSWKHPASQGAVISVNGEGVVTMIPDIAQIAFTVREVAKTVPEAQKLAEKKMSEAVDVLKAKNIEEKDIATKNYSINPKYTYPQIYCITTPCPGSEPKLEGYEVSQTVSVKVRKPDLAGEVLGSLGGLSVTEISGPVFTIDNEDEIRAHAEELAIQEAQAKAKKTADSLGVSLGRIISYNNESGTPYPMYYRDSKVMSASVGGEIESVTIPSGENEVRVRVNITYELD